MASELKAGDRAPSFSLPTQTGDEWDLERALESGPVVLFFYPKDETPVCTAEACSFRDQHEVFVEHGAQVVGVSSDSVSSHQSFASHHKLPYTLLSDRDGQVRAKFGVGKTLGLFDGRVTFVIDKDRTIRHVFRSALAAQRHVDEALRTVQRLSA